VSGGVWGEVGGISQNCQRSLLLIFQ